MESCYKFTEKLLDTERPVTFTN